MRGPFRSVTTHELLHVGPDRLRVSRWRGQLGVAVLVPVPDAPAPSARGVHECVDVLAGRGITQVLTGALSRREQVPFLDAGFRVHEELHLLAHDLRVLPERERASDLRRARRNDRAAALAVDHLAFEPFWRLDESGLSDAIEATPAHRFRVAKAPSGSRAGLSGYAVCGRSGPRGYLQRLAVDPAHQRHGIGHALVVDGLWWMRRHRVEQAVVNTQLGNDGALRLYRQLGFVDQPDGLAVLTCAVGPSPT
jgi:ribosomal protein S18 acetylase RimI-like enzyme